MALSKSSLQPLCDMSRTIQCYLTIGVHVTIASRLTQYRLFSFGRDCNGRTPLHFAAACGHVGILNGLLQVVGGGVHMDNHGYTPLHWACFNGTYQESCVD